MSPPGTSVRSTPSWPASGLVGMGQAAELLSRDRRASKQNAAAAREPLARVATAAAPLVRSTDVAAATEQLLGACTNVENAERLEVALEAFGQAVRAATAAPLSWWARRRAARTAS